MTAQGPLDPAETVRPKTVIIDALDAVLDWRSPPWNIAEDEAMRDYDHLAAVILDLLRKAGFVVVPATQFDGSVEGAP